MNEKLTLSIFFKFLIKAPHSLPVQKGEWHPKMSAHVLPLRPSRWADPQWDSVEDETRYHRHPGGH